jgi:gliding motility-associated protein GldC
MTKSKIVFDVELDKDHVPEKISWSATDNPQGEVATETKAVSISLWDQAQKQSLRIDLWAKDMPVDEMKRFYIESLAGIGDSVKRSTGDEGMAQKIHELCEQLVEYIKNTEDKA